MALAKDIMDREFHTLRPEMTIPQAVELFRNASPEGKIQVFGMVVIDDDGRLIGMLSMYDILLLLRPKHIQTWGDMDDIDTTGLITESIRRAKNVLVGDIMTTELTFVQPDTHLLKCLDIMIKKHIRRIPVVDDGQMVGMVYISRLFRHLALRLAE